MYKTTNISDAEHKAHQEKVKTFQSAHTYKPGIANCAVYTTRAEIKSYIF